MARTVSDRLSTSLGQPVIVEARPGGNASIGIDAVAKADPDGHTMLLGNTSITSLPGFMSLPWQPRDFAGVAMLGQVANVLVVSATLEAKSLKEFVDYARAHPGKLNYASPGGGTSQTLAIERLKKFAGIELVRVGYRGVPPAIPDMITGQIHAAMVPFALAVPHVKSGKLRALAIASPTRNKQLPDVPTMAEAGYPESLVINWMTLLVPAATPKPVIERLNREMAKAMADPEVIARIKTLGGSAFAAGTPGEVDAMLAREGEFWAKFIKEGGLKDE